MTCALNLRSGELALDFLRFTSTDPNCFVETRLRVREMHPGFVEAFVTKLCSKTRLSGEFQQPNCFSLLGLCGRNVHRAVVGHANKVSNFLVCQHIERFQLRVSGVCEKSALTISGIERWDLALGIACFRSPLGYRYCLINVKSGGGEEFSAPGQNMNLSGSSQARDDKFVVPALTAIGECGPQCNASCPKRAKRNQCINWYSDCGPEIFRLYVRPKYRDGDASDCHVANHDQQCDERKVSDGPCSFHKFPVALFRGKIVARVGGGI